MGKFTPTDRAVCMNQRTRLISLARAFHGLEAKALRTNDRLKERKKRYVTLWYDFTAALPCAVWWDVEDATEGISALKQR